MITTLPLEVPITCVTVTLHQDVVIEGPEDKENVLIIVNAVVNEALHVEVVCQQGSPRRGGKTDC